MREFVCFLSERSFLEGKGNTTFHSSPAMAGPDPDWTPFAVAAIPQPSALHCGWQLRQWWGAPLWARLLHVSVGKASPSRHTGLVANAAPPRPRPCQLRAITGPHDPDGPDWHQLGPPHPSQGPFQLSLRVLTLL